MQRIERDKAGVLFRAADDYAAAQELLREVEAHFGANGSDTLKYDDVKRGISRRILVKQDKLAAVILAGDTSAEGWLKAYLENEQSVAAIRRMLLAPSAKAPQGFKARGRIVCNCLNVAESEIEDALIHLQGSTDVRLGALQAKLKCGTNCGSCLPELKALIAQTAPQNLPNLADLT